MLFSLYSRHFLHCPNFTVILWESSLSLDRENSREKQRERWRSPTVIALRRIHWGYTPFLSILKKPSTMINSQQEREDEGTETHTQRSQMMQDEMNHKEQGEKNNLIYCMLQRKTQLSSLSPHSLRVNEPKRGVLTYSTIPTTTLHPCNPFHVCFIAAASQLSGGLWLQDMHMLLQQDHPAISFNQPNMVWSTGPPTQR